MSKQKPLPEYLRDILYVARDAQSNNARTAIWQPDLQVGVPDANAPSRGILLPPKIAPVATNQKLYNENGVLKFSGHPLTTDVSGSIETLSISASGGTVTGDTTITFSDVNDTLSLKAGTNITLAGDASGKAITVTAAGAGSGGGWTDDGSTVRLTSVTDSVGIGTTGPDRKLDILDASNPQLRLTHTDGSKYVDFKVDTNHDLTITPSSTGQIKLQPTSDTTDFFQVLDADGGTPILNVDSHNERVGIGTSTPEATLDVAGHIFPASDVTYDLGSSTKRWANIYTGDLHLKNDRGNWTIIEEEDFLCVVNNLTGKRYKMLLEPLDD